MSPVDIIEGASPLILCQPHSGTEIPGDILARLNARGAARADTDWHIDRLYEGLAPDASVIRARFHRYLIDANRAPDGASLYPGQNTTALCPLTDFDGKAIYEEGCEPDAEEIERRRRLFHAPYHAAIERAIGRAKERHGIAIVYDCHSIRSIIPYLFEGLLPVFNIGTNDGASCDARLEDAVAGVCREAKGYDCIVNGRFKGGWTTRHYGKPEARVHAVQMELSQRAYMNERPPFDYNEEKAARLKPHLAQVLAALEELAVRL
jgi:formiminoglutamase